MSPRIFVSVSMALALCCASLLPAAEEPAMSKDLKATIALQGQTCDQVVNSKRNADSDYLVTCKDGNRYRVFVDAKGRVVVEKK